MKKFTILLISLTMLAAASIACTLTVPVKSVNTDRHIYTAADETLSRITDLATMPAPAAITADGAKVREWKP